MLVSPFAIAAINFLILFLMVLSIVDVAKSIALRANPDELVNIMTTVSSIMIGWGVALEEREVIRRVAGMKGRPDEKAQALIDSQCHSFGVAQLVLGLFSDIPVAMISLPDRIINATGIEYELLWMSVALIAVAAVVQIRHIVLLLTGR
ncbi:hypothetical protein SAMN02745126_00258 [Enhydrobacter aerosaccus]|uniref:Uncharacterized protein n=2 Tax=Enhydrobacter aerosaccus TaxID=225324 RepID=A0A1T4JNS6_9HYPH|nr:hypothetical protein SAMN02745126_00258 [Enhydrobacter aerosaccus]